MKVMRSFAFSSIRIGLLVMVFLAFFSTVSYAQSSNENNNTTVDGDATGMVKGVNNTLKWVCGTLGVLALGYGLISTAIRMASHDPEALKHGVWVIAAGAILFAVPKIIQMIQSWFAFS
jgi:hypothetical protein